MHCTGGEEELWREQKGGRKRNGAGVSGKEKRRGVGGVGGEWSH